MRSQPASSADLSRRLLQLSEKCQRDQLTIDQFLVQARAGLALDPTDLDQFQRQLASPESFFPEWSEQELGLIRQDELLERLRAEVVADLERLSSRMSEVNDLLVERLADQSLNYSKTIQEHAAQKCYLRNQS